MSQAQAFAADTWVIARRGLKHMRRQPEALSDATIQPVMFVLLFAFVFGGAIDVPGGGSYKEFLMGGIFAQTIVFGAFGVALALSNDRNNGAIDRFHSLPIRRGSVLVGTNVEAMNVTGKITTNATPCTPSGVATTLPSSTPIQIIANENASISP